MSLSITVDAYNNLKQYLGIELEEDLEIGHWTDVPIHPLVAEKFGLDVFWFSLGSARKKVQQLKDPDKRIDEWGIEWTKVPL
ncbi:hypothetical protein LCGC14_2150100, partial [marine sediment metagenome]